MSLATTIALLAAAFRPKSNPFARWEAERARIMARCAELESENARIRADNVRLRQIANDLQARLAEAQGQAVRQFAGQHPALPQQGFAMANPGGQQLGAQTLLLDAEFWRNCVPSRQQAFNVFGGRGA
jgi:hypothetical protein